MFGIFFRYRKKSIISNSSGLLLSFLKSGTTAICFHENGKISFTKYGKINKGVSM